MRVVHAWHLPLLPGGEASSVDPQYVKLRRRDAEAVLAQGEADLVAIGREAMNNPNWALMARGVLEPGSTEDVFACWPAQHGWWLEKRAAVLEALGTPPA